MAKGIMRKTLCKLLRGQEGQALPIALAMLAVGSLVVVPLLNLTETALRAGIRDESRMCEHYAANAGVMDGIWEIITDNPNIPPHGENWSHNYSIPDTNNRIVDVTISTIDQTNWKITSTATSGSGASTELNCYVEERPSLPNAITSDQVEIQSSVIINGNVQWESNPFKNNGTINGQIINEAYMWPAIADVSAFYLEQVEGAPTHEGNLDLNLGPETLADPYSLGPIYINGNLTINSNSDGAVRLDGNIYVEGNVYLGPDTTIYMNNFTIFSNGSFTANTWSELVSEYGCIVAEQTITLYTNFEPNSYIVAFSVGGLTNVLTMGEINGVVYGHEDVWVGSGTTLNWSEPPPGLPLPPLPGKVFRIVGWESTTQ